MSLLKIEEDSAQVRIPPPVLLVSCLLLGGILHWLRPIHIFSENGGLVIGPVLIIGGIATIIYSALLFKKAQTNIEPWKTTSNIITTGIYGKTRNPIYLAFLIIGFGVACAVNSLWIALMLLPLILLLRKFVIDKEERYLERKFGQEYLAYKEKVRRWI